MAQLGPIKRQRLIQNLRQLGFEGPYAGGNHQYMIKVDCHSPKLHVTTKISITDVEILFYPYNTNSIHRRHTL
ncbi:MAG: hypothetical protein DCC55_06280 [Chloroflexi bacterium]|nr:MAG: hypothetical protein DCC55_06280 [Chloroflexota bacterium]